MTRIYVDGGCRNNGSPDAQGYGSFLVQGQGVVHRLNLPECNTNNEAEYASLVHALQYAIANKLEHPQFLMDSQLVVNQVKGRWELKAPNLRGAQELAQRLLHEAGGTLDWIGRDEMVRKVGH